jgi:hypothetical protein
LLFFFSFAPPPPPTTIAYRPFNAPNSYSVSSSPLTRSLAFSKEPVGRANEKMQIPHEVLNTVTHVVIDECHHLLAATYRQVHSVLYRPNQRSTGRYLPFSLFRLTSGARVYLHSNT